MSTTRNDTGRNDGDAVAKHIEEARKRRGRPEAPPPSESPDGDAVTRYVDRANARRSGAED